MSNSAPTVPPPGWYLDPATPGVQRWWSGAGWTEHAAPVAIAPAQPRGLEPIDLLVPRPHTFGPRGLIWGIITFILPVAILPAVLALVFSIPALVTARNARRLGQPASTAMPLAGLILGSVSLLAFIVFVIAGVLTTR
jgi:hypothetical protein